MLFSVFFYNSNPNGYEVVSHCAFDLHSLMTSDIDHLFMCFLAICKSSLEKVFCPFSNWVVWVFAVELSEFLIYFGY